MPPKK